MTTVQWIGDIACILCMAVAGIAVRWGLFASDHRRLAELEELKRTQRRVERELRGR